MTPHQTFALLGLLIALAITIWLWTRPLRCPSCEALNVSVIDGASRCLKCGHRWTA